MKTLKTEACKVNTQHSRKVRITKPYSILHQFKAGKQSTGITLLDYVCNRFPYRSAEAWQEKILSGKVGINGKPTSPDTVLKSTDTIFHYNPRVVEPGVPDEVEILKVSDDYLIVYKPAPLPMHPGGRYNKNSLTMILREKGYEDLKIVHRLDSVTSGLVLFARNKEMAGILTKAFRENSVRKQYFALVRGVPSGTDFTIESTIRRKTGFVFESGEGLKDGKYAKTQFKLIKSMSDSNLSILECSPETGRTHQIRLHLESVGLPVHDDPVYGPNGDKSSTYPQKTAISLINTGLHIDHLDINYSIPYPESWDKSAL